VFTVVVVSRDSQCQVGGKPLRRRRLGNLPRPPNNFVRKNSSVSLLETAAPAKDPVIQNYHHLDDCPSVLYDWSNARNFSGGRLLEDSLTCLIRSVRWCGSGFVMRYHHDTSRA